MTTTCNAFDGDKVAEAVRKEGARHSQTLGVLRRAAESGVITEKEAEDFRLLSAMGVITLVKMIFPNIRMATNPIPAVRAVVYDLVDLPAMVGNKLNSLTGGDSLDAFKTVLLGEVGTTMGRLKKAFRAAKKAGQWDGTRDTFYQEIVRASRRLGDDEVHANPFIEQGRQAFRSTLNRHMRRGLANGLFGDITEDELQETLERTAAGYVTRIVLSDKLMDSATNLAVRDALVADFIRKGAQRELVRSGLTAEEAGRRLQRNAQDIVNQWAHQPGIRSPYDSVVQLRRKAGPTFQRTVTIKDQILDDLGVLSNDPQRILFNYLNSVGIDAEVAARYGTKDGQLLEDAINRNFDELLETKRANEASKRELNALQRAKVRGITDAQHILAEIRGTHHAPRNALTRITHPVRQTIGMSRLGLVALTSIPDVAIPVLEFGLTRTIRDGWIPVLQSVAKWDFTPALRSNSQAAGQVLEVMLGLTARQEIGLVGDLASRGLFGKAFDTFNLLNGLRFWDDLQKMIAGSMTQRWMLDMASKVDRGVKISARETTMLNRLRISEKGLAGFSDQVRRNGAQVSDWDDPDIARMYLTGLNNQVRRTLVSVAAGERPIVVMESEMAQLMTQFQTFTMASTTKILIPTMQNLAMRDAWAAAHAFQYMFLATNVALLSDAIKRRLNDDDREFEPQDLLVRALNRSGIFGLLPEVLGGANGISRQRLADTLGLDTQRGFDAAKEFGDLALGPSFGFGVDATRVSSAVLSGDGFSRADVRAVPRLLPFQNLWEIRLALEANRFLQER